MELIGKEIRFKHPTLGVVTGIVKDYNPDKPLGLTIYITTEGPHLAEKIYLSALDFVFTVLD